VSSFSTAPLELPTFADRADVTRADLVFYEVDHRGPSYVAHVFLGQPDASGDTPHDVEHGYAGFFTVFGHGGCFGDEGHCDAQARYVDAFDHRLRHPLTPFVKTLTVTDALEPALLDPKRTKIAVTVVIEPPTAAPAAPFELVRLLTYVD
jgi:tyrosinase